MGKKVGKKLENSWKKKLEKSWKKVLNKSWEKVGKKLEKSFKKKKRIKAEIFSTFSSQLITLIKCLMGLKSQKSLFITIQL